MSAKQQSVAVNDLLLAEARRLAGVRTSTAAVNAALREFVGRRGGKTARKSPAKKTGGAKDFVELAEYMRDSGWNGFDYKAQRRRFGRRFDDIG